MRTVGQILKETREAKLYTLEDIEKHTKIRKELLRALENNEYTKLPPSTFIQGFIKNYGKFLGLNSNQLLALFRRDFEAKKHPPLVLDTFAKPLEKTRLIITPSRLLGLAIFLIIVSFFAYLWVEYRQFVSPPLLLVSSPTEGVTVDIPQVRVEGKTDPEVKVDVNEQEIGVDKDGNFSEEIKLSSSSNKVIIKATSRFGRSAQQEITVFVQK